MKMRMTLLVLTMVFCVSVGITKAAHVNLWQTINDNEDEVVYNLESSDENSVVFEFKLNGFDLEDVSIHGKDFKKIILPRSGDLGETGKPDLPAMSKMIVLPARSGARYEILETDTYELTGIDIAPLQPSRWDSDPEEPPFTKDYDFYKRDEFYPSQRVTISKPVIMRELRMLPIDFYPVSYNPATKTVKIIRRMKIAVYFEGQGENPKVRNFEGISSSFIQAQKYSYSFRAISVDAAPENPGRFPRLVSAAKVNWLTINALPPISRMERFMRPSSS